MQNIFKWLQFSDLHLSMESFDTEFVRERLIEFLNEQKFECDCLFITGDIANRGDYTGAEHFVKDRLLKEIRVKNKENIYWCIGNHDIKRDSKFRKNVINGIRAADDPCTAFETAMRDEAERDLMTSAGLKNYLEAHRRIIDRELSRKEVFEAHTFHDLGMCNLVVLNTCITYCGDQDEGRLLLLEKHLLEILGKAKDKNKPFIAIGHHGKEFFYTRSRNDYRFERMLDSAGVDLYLCGHSHSLGYDCYVNTSYDIHQITCGGGDPSDGYSIFSFILGEYNRADYTVKFTPYSYSERSGKFYVDYISHPRLNESSRFELKRIKSFEKQNQHQETKLKDDIANTVCNSTDKYSGQSQLGSFNVSGNTAGNMFVAQNVTIDGGLNFGRKQ